MTALAQSGVTETIAIQGDVPPDGNGTLARFNVPVLNDAGQVAFTARMINTAGGNDDDHAVFRADASPNSLVVIRREFRSIFGTGTVDIDGIPAINNHGQVAGRYRALGLLGGDRDAYFISDGVTSEQITPFGQTAPDGTGTFTDSLPFHPPLSDTGAVAFIAQIEDPSGMNVGSGVYRGDGIGPLVQIVRSGDTAPNGVGAFVGFFETYINGSNQVGFRATLSAATPGLFRGEGGAVTRLGRRGQPAPDGLGSLVGAFRGSHLNAAGAIAWAGEVDTASTRLGAILRSDGNTLTEIAREGDPAPDGDGVFIELVQLGTGIGIIILTPPINDAGQVAFKAVLGDTAAIHGVFRGDGDDLTQIARTGQPLPDGVGVFDVLTLDFVRHVALAPGGQVLFSADLAGSGVNLGNDRGIFLGDGVDVLTVAREGDALAGGIIDVFNFRSLAPSQDQAILVIPDNGGRTSINTFAQVAFSVTLANGRDGVFLFTPRLRWRAGGDGDWDDMNNWTLGLPPAEVHPVEILSDDPLTVTGPAAAAVVRSLTIGGGSAASTLVLQPGGGIGATERVVTEPNGVLAGEGMLNADVTNAGLVEPGADLGQLAITGDYDQTGVLDVDIDAGGHDALIVSGAADLGGELMVRLAPGFAPHPSDEFEIISAAMVAGTFAEVMGPHCPLVTYESDRVLVSFPCFTDLNTDGATDVFDLLAYLNLWFAGDAAADRDGANGVDVFDLLAYLDCWFPASADGGCS